MNITRPDRVARGVLLSAQGHVSREARDRWTVRSESDPQINYTVTPQSCACPDWKKNQAICKHHFASAGFVAAFVVLALRKAPSISIANRILEPASAIIASLPAGYGRTISDEYSLAVKRISKAAAHKAASDSPTAQQPRPTPAPPILIKRDCSHPDCKTSRCNYDKRVGGISV